MMPLIGTLATLVCASWGALMLSIAALTAPYSYGKRRLQRKPPLWLMRTVLALLWVLREVNHFIPIFIALQYLGDTWPGLIDANNLTTAFAQLVCWLLVRRFFKDDGRWKRRRAKVAAYVRNLGHRLVVQPAQ